MASEGYIRRRSPPFPAGEYTQTLTSSLEGSRPELHNLLTSFKHVYQYSNSERARHRQTQSPTYSPRTLSECSTRSSLRRPLSPAPSHRQRRWRRHSQTCGDRCCFRTPSAGTAAPSQTSTAACAKVANNKSTRHNAGLSTAACVITTSWDPRLAAAYPPIPLPLRTFIYGRRRRVVGTGEARAAMCCCSKSPDGGTGHDDRQGC
jgi:hypothetical protein